MNFRKKDNQHLNRKYKDIEPQQVLLDKLSQKKEKEMGLSERRFEVPLYKNIIIGFFVVVLLVFIGFLIQISNLQIVKNDYFTALAERNKFRNEQIEALRGVIYSNEKNQLVNNQLSFSLTCKEDLSEKTIQKISNLIGEPTSKIKEKLERSSQSDVVIVDNLKRKVLLSIETKINETPSCQITQRNSREYPNGELFSHVLGYIGKIDSEELLSLESYSGNDYVGKAGLEKEYEQVLHRKPGNIQVERDALGNEISKKIVSKPEAGENLLLWLDNGLQRKLTNSLQDKLNELESSNAVGVVLDADSGGVLSLVSIPSYDNNIFRRENSEEISEILSNPGKSLFNRAITGQYPSGSVIKPIIALAALEENIISPQKRIDDTKGYIEIPNPYNPEDSHIFHDWEAHGMVNMRKAIAVSCNVYFYTIGGGYEGQEGLGVSKINKYLELFGFGSETGIDLPAENNGLVPTPEWKEENKDQPWRTGDTYNLSIGQGNFLATPLQVATAFLPIANGGTLYKPQIVQKVIKENKEVEQKPEVLRDNFIKPDHIKIVKEGMKEGVEYGSAVTLSDLPVTAGAKTGTAQTSKAEHYHNWVVIFAPYEDPEIVMTLMIEDVKGMKAAVLPVAKDVLSWYFKEGEEEKSPSN